MTLLSFLRTQIAQIKGIISLTLVINISKIPNISGLYIPNTKDTKKRNISLALVICGALKERYLKGQSVRAVIWIVIVY